LSIGGRANALGLGIGDWGLARDEFLRIARWIREREQRQWDERLDRDSASGKLDFLFEEAEAESKAGGLRERPPRK
jgi:hypothetical protein